MSKLCDTIKPTCSEDGAACLLDLTLATQSMNQMNVTRRGVPMPEEVSVKILKDIGLSQAGVAAVEAAIDPFHDYMIHNHLGWPDQNQANSVLEVLNRQVLITSAAASWDCSLVITPFSDIFPISYNNTPAFYGGTGLPVVPSTAITPLLFQQYTDVIDNYGGISIMTAASGTTMLPTPVGGGAVTTLALSPFTDVADATTTTRPFGAFRIVSCGLEVINVTQEINKQGSVTCWRYPDALESCNCPVIKLNGLADPIVESSCVAKVMRNPPVSLNEATFIPGAQSWKAADGCYIVGALSGDLEPARLMEGNVIIANEQLSSQTLLASNPGQYNTSLNTANHYKTSTAIHESHLQQGGAFFAGLGANNVLQVKMRWYVEVFPNVGDLNLMPLARPSAAFDPRALEIYSKAIVNLPVGCPVGDNAHGSFWKRVISTVATGSKKAVQLAGSSGIADMLGKTPQGRAALGAVTAFAQGANTLNAVIKDDKKKSSKKGK